MKQYIVDAFTDKVFSGNPAAVCVMDIWPEDDLMQKVALENNLSETAFAVREGEAYRLRWFTPCGEIDLCGHATLAASFVILNFYQPGTESVSFETRSGQLTVTRKRELYEMDFPANPLPPVPVTPEMAEALGGVVPLEAYLSRDLLLVLDSAEKVRQMNPDMEKLKSLDGLLAAVTAPDTEYDCVSRVFGPKLRVPEDPVTGSAHCMIVPYWSKRLAKREIKAYQASPRGGELRGSVDGNRVLLSGKAALFSIGEILPQ